MLLMLAACWYKTFHKGGHEGNGADSITRPQLEGAKRVVLRVSVL